jgi:hypothetical protein
VLYISPPNPNHRCVADGQIQTYLRFGAYATTPTSLEAAERLQHLTVEMVANNYHIISLGLIILPRSQNSTCCALGLILV